MEVREQLIDREAFVRPVSAQDPSGPWLRREGLHAEVQEAMRAAPGDPAYGIPAKTPDWELVVRLCAGALNTKTKDLYLATCLLEGCAHLHGAEGISAGLWVLAELHQSFGDDFHPRPRSGSQEGRVNQLEALRKALPRILDAVQMSTAVPGLTWFHWQHAGQKLPGGDPSPYSEDDRARAVDESEEWFHAGGARALTNAETELARLDALVAERYGTDGPSLSEAKELLGSLRGTFEELAPQAVASSRIEDPEKELARVEPTAPISEQALKSTPSSRRRNPEAAVSAPADGAYTALFLALRALRKREPGNNLPYLAVRWLAFSDLRNFAPEAPPAALPSPTTAERARLARLFSDERWAELLERVEVLLEQPAAAYWLDLQRYASAAMGQIGAPYGEPRRALHSLLAEVLEPQAWILEAKLQDGTPAADEITGPWLRSLFRGGQEPREVDAGSADSNLVAELEAARTTAANQGLQVALEGLEEKRRGAASERERLTYTRFLASLLAEQGLHGPALALLEGAWQEVERRGLAAWEGPRWTAGLLAEVDGSLRHLARTSPSAKVDARLEELDAQWVRVDPLRALKKPD